MVVLRTPKMWCSSAHSPLRTVVSLELQSLHIGILNSSALLSQPVQQIVSFRLSLVQSLIT